MRGACTRVVVGEVMRTDQIKYSLKVEPAGFADFRYKAKKKKKKKAASMMTLSCLA